jgi:chromosome segregation ATPase
MLISSNSTTYHLYHQKTPEEVEAALALQESVKATAKSSLSESNSTGDTVNFLSNAMEELLANKIGVDKEKLDELKKEIEALESVKNPTQEQKERLVMLTKKLEEMVKEATEQTAEQEAKRVPDNKIQTYRDIDAMTSLF